MAKNASTKFWILSKKPRILGKIKLILCVLYFVQASVVQACDPLALPEELVHSAQAKAPGFCDWDSVEQNHFLIVYAKLVSEGLWDEVGEVLWAGPQGVMLFKPKFAESLFIKKLNAGPYGNYWSASRDARWGVRSRFRGAQLHFKASAKAGESIVAVHLDLHNPGDPLDGRVTSWFQELGQAILHYRLDMKDRARTHTLPAMARALEDDGIEVFQLAR